jgi:trans-aconitate 2-methyltransferase
VQADVASWAPERPPDLIFSNAALHWLDDHRELFHRLAGYLKPGGCLATQMPLSWDLPSHRLMRRTLSDGVGSRPFGNPEIRRAARRRPVARAADYFGLLEGIARQVDIWETEYLQVLIGEDAVYEWVSGTGLRPILDGLAEMEKLVFIEEYKRRLREAYPMRPDGTTLYPFRRLFIVAQV